MSKHICCVFAVTETAVFLTAVETVLKIAENIVRPKREIFARKEILWLTNNL